MCVAPEKIDIDIILQNLENVEKMKNDINDAGAKAFNPDTQKL